MSSISDELPSVVVIPPNSSSLLLDSRYRGVGQYPTNFSSYLTSGLVAKQLKYKNLQWSMPLFTHTTLNNEIRFVVENDDLGQIEYCVYAMTWTIFKQFDGNPPGGGFNPPQTASYAKDIETAFNTDVREVATNLVLAAPITVGGLNITWHFEYNQAQGFVLFCEDSNDISN